MVRRSLEVYFLSTSPCIYMVVRVSESRPGCHGYQVPVVYERVWFVHNVRGSLVCA
jgi:hypothetical protein